MLSKLTGVAVLTITATIGAGALLQDEAMAKGRCTTGQIFRVSSGTCMSRSAAVEQGIIGGKHRAQADLARKTKPASQEVVAEKDATDAPETTTVARTSSETPGRDSQPARPARQMVSDVRSTTAVDSSAGSAVRIEVVKTEPRPTPAILTPTWPYGELPSFPKHNAP